MVLHLLHVAAVLFQLLQRLIDTMLCIARLWKEAVAETVDEVAVLARAFSADFVTACSLVDIDPNFIKPHELFHTASDILAYGSSTGTSTSMRGHLGIMLFDQQLNDHDRVRHGVVAGSWEAKHIELHVLFNRLTRKGHDLRQELFMKAMMKEFFSVNVRMRT